MRATTTRICPFEDTVPTRVTVVTRRKAVRSTTHTQVPHYSVAEVIQAQLSSGPATLYIPRRVV